MPSKKPWRVVWREKGKKVTRAYTHAAPAFETYNWRLHHGYEPTIRKMPLDK